MAVTNGRANARKTITTGFRFVPEDLAEIDRLAAAHGLSRTQFVTDASLGRLGGVNPVENEIEAIKGRLSRLEELAFG